MDDVYSLRQYFPFQINLIYAMLSEIKDNKKGEKIDLEMNLLSKEVDWTN